MEPPRKRPNPDNEDTSTAKKRALTGPNGSPRVNGSMADHDEPNDNDNLELFRKEAIFRRMKYYSREHERSQSRIAELERRKHTCEAGLAAMSACWSQLLQTIRLLVKPEDFPQVKEEIFDFTLRIQDDSKSDFVKTLEDNMSATQNLVTKLVKTGGGLETILQQDNALKECQKATSECISLRSQIDYMHVKLRDSEVQKNQYHEALVAAENRLDRSRSRTVLAIQAQAVETKQEPEDAMEESQRKPSSPESPKSPMHTNGVCDPVELDVLRGQVSAREAKIVDMESEVRTLRDEKAALESELKSLSYEAIVENPHYKVLLDHAAFLQGTATEKRTQIIHLTEEIEGLKTSRKEWEEGIISATNQATQELKIMLTKRDADNARLRDQREQQAAELNERKHKDNVKFASTQELKALAESRSERILVLESEVRRHKAQLAANAGNEDLMLYFTGGNIDEAVYIESLKDRVTAAENRAAALEQTLSIFDDDHPDVVEHMKAEADALQKLSEAEAQLVKYKTIYGDNSTLPPDVSKMAEQLGQKEDEIQKLRLLDIHHTQAETSLYAELDKLSAAWEALDRQVKSKLFDLTTMEDRLAKTSLERAKSENKFYSAMRDKETIETERKILSRLVEKHVKVVERLAETERNYLGQLTTIEKELAAQKIGYTSRGFKLEELQEEVKQWKGLAEAEKRKMADLRTQSMERERAVEIHKRDLRKLEDGLIRSKKELEHRRKEVVNTQNIPDQDHLLQLLKCSCRRNFRNTIITKCMHTFCKECVDARISTRQRKCSSCGVAFSQSDVLYGMYFQ